MDADKKGHHNGGGVDDTDEETNRGTDNVDYLQLHMRCAGLEDGLGVDGAGPVETHPKIIINKRSG
jgi:hypothetical protein